MKYVNGFPPSHSRWNWGIEKLSHFSGTIVDIVGTSLVAQRVKRLPGMRETWVWSLSWENPLEKEMATHSSTLAWRIPWREEPGRLQSMGSQRAGHDWVTSLHLIVDILNIQHNLLLRNNTVSQKTSDSGQHSLSTGNRKFRFNQAFDKSHHTGEVHIIFNRK